MSTKKSSKAPLISAQQKQKQELSEMKKNDPSHLKQQIFELRQQLRDIVDKKIKLENQIKVDMTKNILKTEVIQDNLRDQEEQLVHIQNRYHEVIAVQGQQIKSLKKKYDKQQQQLQQRNKKQQQKKKQQLDQLSQKVSYLTDYKSRRPKYIQSIAQLNERLEQMQKKQEKDIKNIQNHHQKQRSKNEKETMNQMERIKQSEVNRLEQKMTREQFVKRENQVMMQEIQLCQGQLKVLEAQCAQLKGEIEGEKSVIGGSVLGNQASQTYERSLRIIKLEGKLSKLKTYLAEQSGKLQKQYSELDINYTKQQQELQTKISKIDGWMRLKQRDLKKVKACCQMVLNQRSNLQSYLLEVFHEHPEINYKEQRNINKILRYLFSKINSKKPPMTYKNYLPESLRSISQSSFRA